MVRDNEHSLEHLLMVGVILNSTREFRKSRTGAMLLRYRRSRVLIFCLRSNLSSVYSTTYNVDSSECAVF